MNCDGNLPQFPKTHHSHIPPKPEHWASTMHLARVQRWTLTFLRVPMQEQPLPTPTAILTTKMYVLFVAMTTRSKIMYGRFPVREYLPISWWTYVSSNGSVVNSSFFSSLNKKKSYVQLFFCQCLCYDDLHVESSSFFVQRFINFRQVVQRSRLNCRKLSKTIERCWMMS